jgi:hypothetical protein
LYRCFCDEDAVDVLEIQYAPPVIGAAVLHATAPIASGGCGLQMHIRTNETSCAPFVGSKKTANSTDRTGINSTTWTVAPPLAPAAGMIATALYMTLLTSIHDHAAIIYISSHGSFTGWFHKQRDMYECSLTSSKALLANGACGLKTQLIPCNSGDCSIARLVAIASEDAPISWFVQATGIAFDNDTMLDVLGGPLPGLSGPLSAALTIPSDDGMLTCGLPIRASK